MRVFGRCLLCLGVLALIPLAPAAQQASQPVPIRIRADYVEVDAFVTDSKGQFVRTLNKNDFSVLEDGKPVPVAALDLVDLPRSLKAPSFSTDVVTNRDAAMGRIYLIILDDLHTTPEESPRTIRTASQFVEQNIGPNDLAAVVLTSGRVSASQDLTSNHQALTEAIRRFVGIKALSSTLATSTGGVPAATLPGQSAPFELERLHQARTSLDTIERVIDVTRPMHGRRKALILISEGMDFDPGSRTTPPDIRKTARDVIDAANHATVSIYAIDPRGISQGGEHAAELAGTGASQTTLQDEVRSSVEGLRTLAEETGGRFFLRSSDVAATFASIDEANSTYYLLAYTSPAPDDGKFHSIDVKVRLPDVKVRARKGYIKSPSAAAPPIRPLKDLSAELGDALVDPRSSAAMVLAAGATVFRGDNGPSVSALLHISGRSLTFAPVGDKMHAAIEAAVLAFDASSHSRNGDRVELQMDLSAENHALAQAAGIVVPFRIDLPPGRYRLRMGARDTASAHIGTVTCDVDVQDVTSAPLTFSGIVLAGGDASDPPVVRPDTWSERVLGQQATLTREFASTSTIVAGAEVYAAAPGAPRTIAGELRGPDGTLAWSGEACHVSSEPVTTCRVGIPLSSLPTGVYSLRFSAGPAADGSLASRPASFVVR